VLAACVCVFTKWYKYYPVAHSTTQLTIQHCPAHPLTLCDALTHLQWFFSTQPVTHTHTHTHTHTLSPSFCSQCSNRTSPAVCTKFSFLVTLCRSTWQLPSFPYDIPHVPCLFNSMPIPNIRFTHHFINALQCASLYTYIRGHDAHVTTAASVVYTLLWIIRLIVLSSYVL
jgi:hypothetical protein